MISLISLISLHGNISYCRDDARALPYIKQQEVCHITKKMFLILAIALMLLIAAPAAAKSMYVIGAINAPNAPILSYNLNPDGTFTYQTTTNIDQHN